jgi:dTDP-4-dehydrorhamnose reductase
MTILVCGASGILGKDLCNLLKTKNIKYIGTYNNNFIENAIKIDFFNLQNLEEIFQRYNITICINCIVERQVEICQENWNEIKKINIDLPNNLSKICNNKNIHLIHFSTDYIFDGMNSPYFPDNTPNPLQNYGISKYISECKILANIQKYTIIRVPVLYTENINYITDNAVTLIGKKVLNRIEISKEDNYSIRRPNYIPDFCNFILDIIIDKPIGIYHFCNPYDKVTKFQIAKLISKFLNKNVNIISIDEEPKDNIERPKDTYLKDNKYDITRYQFTPLQNGIEKCFQKLWHPKLNINTNENTKDIFFMIDLDGTLIDSDELHYNAYKIILEKYNITLSYRDFFNIIENEGIDKYLCDKFGSEEKNKIKNAKQNILLQTKIINLMHNASKFIEYIYDYDINHVVVTNTNLEIVNFLKSRIPILNKIKNWVTREDYIYPKPNSESYNIGKQKYYKNEPFIIGFENTLNGYTSLKNVTDCIYIMTNIYHPSYNLLKNKDTYLINDFNSLFE